MVELEEIKNKSTLQDRVERWWYEACLLRLVLKFHFPLPSGKERLRKGFPDGVACYFMAYFW